MCKGKGARFGHFNTFQIQLDKTIHTMRNATAIALLISLAAFASTPVGVCAFGKLIESISDTAREIVGPLVHTATHIAKAEHTHWLQDR